jgi:hypothetical protein
VFFSISFYGHYLSGKGAKRREAETPIRNKFLYNISLRNMGKRRESPRSAAPRMTTKADRARNPKTQARQSALV